MFETVAPTKYATQNIKITGGRNRKHLQSTRPNSKWKITVDIFSSFTAAICKDRGNVVAMRARTICPHQ